MRKRKIRKPENEDYVAAELLLSGDTACNYAKNSNRITGEAAVQIAALSMF